MQYLLLPAGALLQETLHCFYYLHGHFFYIFLRVLLIMIFSFCWFADISCPAGGRRCASVPSHDRQARLCEAWMLGPVCLHGCAGEMEEVGGELGGVHVQAASGSWRQKGNQATLQRPGEEEGAEPELTSALRGGKGGGAGRGSRSGDTHPPPDEKCGY